MRPFALFTVVLTSWISVAIAAEDPRDSQLVASAKNFLELEFKGENSARRWEMVSLSSKRRAELGKQLAPMDPENFLWQSSPLLLADRYAIISSEIKGGNGKVVIEASVSHVRDSFGAPLRRAQTTKIRRVLSFTYQAGMWKVVDPPSPIFSFREYKRLLAKDITNYPIDWWLEASRGQIEGRIEAANEFKMLLEGK